MSEMFSGNWTHTTSARADIAESLRYAADKILGLSLGNLVPDEIPLIVSDRVYHWMASYHARLTWREMYRAARLLGNRELAFDKIGDQRKFHFLPPGVYRENPWPRF